MSKFKSTILASVVAFSAVAFVSSGAFAAVTALGNLDPVNAGSYNETDGIGAIAVEGTFTLTNGAKTSISATIATASAAAYTPGVLEIFKGATLIDSIALAFNGSAYTASFTDNLGPGLYTAEITGTVNVAKLGIGGTVSTSVIPEPSTWAMMLLGFADLGYAAFRRNSGSQGSAVAV